MGTKSAYPMVSIEDAEKTIISSLEALPIERIAVTEALGRILRADVVFPEDMPAFPASLKDGYAIVSSTSISDKQVLRIREDLASHAGTPHTTAPEPLKEGEVAYIATGAPVPAGATAVAMIEVCDTSAVAGSVQILGEDWPENGTDIRRVGSDARKGELLLEKYQRISAGEIGLLIASGITHIEVTRQVKIGVLSTGDELVDDDGGGKDIPLTKGLIRDANRPMLLALIKTYLSGFAVGIDIGIVRDDEKAVEDRLREAYEKVDLLITSGGVSMGQKDYLKAKIGDLNKIHFGRINMKPGKPLTFATNGASKGTVALPGNPVSSFVCFHVAAKLAARALAGIPVANNQSISVVLGHEFARDKIRPEFHRASVEWREAEEQYIATSTGKQASSRLASVRAANALVLLPNGAGKVAKGARAKAFLL